MSHAIKFLGDEILLNHMKKCMVEDIKNGDEAVALEVMELARRLR